MVTALVGVLAPLHALQGASPAPNTGALTIGGIVLRIGIVFALVLANAFFVAAEFALVARVFPPLGIFVPPVAVHTTAAAITAFLVITFLHIVLGELAPKSIALVKPERVSKLVVRPLLGFAAVMSPLIRLLNGAANVVLRTVGIRPSTEAERVHSPDELRLLVMQSRAHGALDETDSAMLAGVFDFHEKSARDGVRPR